MDLSFSLLHTDRRFHQFRNLISVVSANTEIFNFIFNSIHTIIYFSEFSFQILMFFLTFSLNYLKLQPSTKLKFSTVKMFLRLYCMRAVRKSFVIFNPHIIYLSNANSKLFLIPYLSAFSILFHTYRILFFF